MAAKKPGNEDPEAKAKREERERYDLAFLFSFFPLRCFFANFFPPSVSFLFSVALF